MNLYWLLPAVAIAHVFEEFFFPGGFTDWDRSYRRDLASSITTPFHIVINIIFIGVCFLPPLLTERFAIAWRLCIGSVLLMNSLFHIGGAYKTKKYSPGVLTSIALFIPVAAFGYWLFLSTQKTTLAQALASSATGVSYLVLSTVV